MQFSSTHNPALRANLRQALQSNMAADGGLFCPLPTAWRDWPELLAMPWPERGAEMVARFNAGELDDAAVRAAAVDALSIAVPLVPLGDELLALELFHGPSLAFKDFGARLLARLLPLADDQPDLPRTILTATSGDTGAAVAAAFAGVAGARAVVLYPAGRISELQERQIACLGGNTLAVQVAGSFDDCQGLVKQAFHDRDLSSQLRLTSANSIHVGRLLAQITYFSQIPALLSLSGRSAAATLAVPCGNFGHLAAGLYAQQLGMPVGQFVVATNRNRTVPDYLETGHYQPRPSVATPSNAMDVGAPNNWPRIAALFGGDWQQMRRQLRWHSADDAQTLAEMRRLHTDFGYLACPHSAVAALALAHADGAPKVFLATAHPAKFGDIVEQAAGAAPELPAELAALLGREIRCKRIETDYAALKALLLA